ncbi:MAG: polysaccharide deacetylase family protein [Clostridia bacterium]|nr:polysaccharide deacetylase family protein [Clostridia bacterium]
MLKIKDKFVRFMWKITIFYMISALCAGTLLTGTHANAAKNDDKLIAITFDDGPGIYTSDLIDRLNERGVKATFFIVGSNAEYYPDVIKKAADSGHELGNHSYDHALLTDIGEEQLINEISLTNDILKKADGKDRHLIRPPYGEFNDAVAKAAASPMIYWSVDTEDWKSLSSEAVYNHIMTHAYDGAVILMHDIYGTSCDGAIWAIDELLENGYSFVTVSELFEKKGITLQDGVMYYDAVRSSSPTPTEAPKETPSPEPKKEDKKESVKTSKVTLTTETRLLSESEDSASYSAVLSKGISLEVWPADKTGYHKVKTPWGKEGFITEENLKLCTSEQTEKKYSSPGLPDTPTNIKRVTKTATGIYANTGFTEALGYIGGKQEITLLGTFGNGVCLIETELGKTGFVPESRLQNYHVSPFKSVILDIPESGYMLTDANLRIEPDENSPILGVLTKDVSLQVTGSSGVWFKVNLGDFSGYIRDYTISGNEDSIFEKATVKEDSKLYCSPDKKSDSLGKVQSGTVVYILNKSNENYYLILAPSGGLSYIASKNIE